MTRAPKSLAVPLHVVSAFWFWMISCKKSKNSVDSSPFFLHTSGQTQSTPSLLWGINTAGENGVANASEAKSAAAPGSNLSMRRQKAKTVGEVQAQEEQQNGNHECSPQRQHTESSPTPAMVNCLFKINFSIKKLFYFFLFLFIYIYFF